MKVKNNKSHWLNYTSESDNEIMIYRDIGYFGLTAENFRSKYLSMQNNSLIDLRMNSYGGEVFDGFAIFNTILENADKFKSINDGISASISAYIPLAANKRVAHSNSWFMFHNPSVMIIGDSNELRKDADLMDGMREALIARMLELMSPNGYKKEDILKIINDETWMNAKKALEVGIIQEIIDPIQVDEPETNMNIIIPKNISKKSIFLNIANVKTKPLNNGGAMKKCPHCGKEISEESVFCNHCGERVIAKTEPLDDAIKREQQEAIDAAVDAERKRVENIRAACTKHKLSEDVIKGFIDSKKPYNEIAPVILDKITVDPIAPNNNQNVQFGKDETEKFISHASNCLLIASGIEKSREAIEAAKGDIFINGLHTLMRVHLEKRGEGHAALDANGLVEKCFRMIGTGISDLPAALEDTVNKSMKRGFEEAPTTYQIWTGRREVTDFKTNSIYQVSNFGDLKDMADGSEFEDSKLADSKETFSISTKGRKFTIGRQAFINDDVDAFSKVPMTMGRAAGRRINKDVYDGMTSNSLAGPAMTDTNYLFDSTNHSNVKASSGVVSTSSIDVAERLLMEMPLLKAEPDSQTTYQGLTGRYIVTGTAKRLTILQVLGTPYDISKSIVGVVNPYNLQNLTPVFDPYLQSLLTAGSKANAWYMVADQMASESVGVAFLRGNTTPTMRRAMSSVGMPLGIVFDIYFDWGIYYADYRGIIYNDGA